MIDVCGTVLIIRVTLMHGVGVSDVHVGERGQRDNMPGMRQVEGLHPGVRSWGSLTRRSSSNGGVGVSDMHVGE